MPDSAPPRVGYKCVAVFLRPGMLLQLASTLALADSGTPTHFTLWQTRGCNGNAIVQTPVIDSSIYLDAEVATVPQYFRDRAASIAQYESIVALYPQRAALAANATQFLKEYWDAYGGKLKDNGSPANLVSLAPTWNDDCAKQVGQVGNPHAEDQCNMLFYVSSCGQRGVCINVGTSGLSFRFDCTDPVQFDTAWIVCIVIGVVFAGITISVIVWYEYKDKDNEMGSTTLLRTPPKKVKDDNRPPVNLTKTRINF